MSSLKKLLLISVVTLAISSCGKAPVADTDTNPYPTLPLGATGIALAPAVGGDFEAKGNEPFWNAMISASGVVFTRPGDEAVETTNYETRQEEKDGMIVIKDAKGEFFVTLTKGNCSDGMSDMVYEYNANVALGSEDLKGCANKK